MICRHCKESAANRPKGLCWSCYYTPEIRSLYPTTSKFAPGSKVNFGRTPPCMVCGDPTGIVASEVQRGRDPICVVCRKPEHEREFWRAEFARLEALARQEKPLADKQDRYVRRVPVDNYKEPIHGLGAFEETTDFTTAGAEGYAVHVYENPYGFRYADGD